MIWFLITDLGCIALLLLVGQFLRAKVKLIQKLFLPASVIAGFLGLALGPEGLNYIPFSMDVDKYPEVLVALLFASLPFASQGGRLQRSWSRVTRIWIYSTQIILLQWGLGMLFGLWVLRVIWPELHHGFGALLASGFVGGHGTATALGATFVKGGWADAPSLAMTAATVGLLGSISGGMLWLVWGSRRQATRLLPEFESLPEELRTGLISPSSRTTLGKGTMNAISIDPIGFHLAVLFLITGGAYFFSAAIAPFFGDFQIPLFSLTFVFAILMKVFFRLTRVQDYVDRKTMVRLSGTVTDFLVAFGIASIDIAVVLRYSKPLLLLFVFGFVLCGLIFRFVGPQVFRKYWFEKSLFTWGWVTGIIAMSVALLRMVDPQNESEILEDFAISYLAIGPVEVVMVAIGPLLIVNGQHLSFTIFATAAGLTLLLVSFLLRKSKDAPFGES